IELARRNPVLDFRESKKYVANDRVQVTHTLSTSTEEKIQRIKNLLSHVNPFMSREEVLDYMAECTLDAIDPLRKAQRAEVRKTKVRKRSEKRRTDVGAEIDVVQSALTRSGMELMANSNAEHNEQSLSAQRIEFSEFIEPETGEIQLVATFAERSRTIAAKDDHAVWMKNADEGCEFVDPETSRRCGAKHQPQRDHILEFSRGGSSAAGNLQLMCAQHNRFRWRQRSRVREIELKYA
ncbi:MAG: HNH endonuclease signature motif containing protein, partial [Bdellovibrionota bacterium]